MTADAATGAAGILARHRRRALVVGLLGLGVFVLGGALWPMRVFHGWLFAVFFWIGVSLGCLSIVMIQHVTGGAWGLAIRRLLEAGARTIPAMGVLFLPLLFGLRKLYPWARPETVAADPLLVHKSIYLNTGFFVVRAACYFAAWSVLAWMLTRMSRRQDAEGGDASIDRLQKISGGGLLVFVFTMTFASVDWVMSLEPHWFSTIYAALLMAGQAVSAFCLVIAVACILARTEPLARIMTPRVLHDLGKLLFAFVLVWAYFALSQFLIIWSGNLPEEIPWYLRRLQGGWQWVALAVVLFHFALPFLLLLSRNIKRNAKSLLRVAMLIFAMRVADLYWMMAPGFSRESRAHWMDLAAVIGVGGIWVFLFAGQLARAPLLPRQDPYLAEALAHAEE